jgi:heme A synthase
MAAVTPSARFARFAWALLAVDVAVVAWGAYVRASGSGAGCGRHWPLCNGEVVPRAPGVQMLVELSHRVSSGLVMALTAVLLVWAWRAFPRGHVVRTGAAVSMALMMTEALLGAGLVLFELVAHDASMKRALSVSLHLLNTFVLLGSTALTAWWASGGARPKLRGQGTALVAAAVPVGLMLVVGASGAVTALGDTLYPPASLAAGLAQDLSPGANAFIKLRAIHPAMAVTTFVAILVGASILRAVRTSPVVHRLSYLVSGLAVAQVGLGVLDVITLAPVWLQLVHVAMADAVWCSLVILAGAALADAPAQDYAASASDAGAARTANTRLHNG